jgi:Tfp pilus assembly protein PilX
MNPLRRQAGAAALAVTVMLVFGASIAVFYLNRSLVFEQKTSANQYRSTTALEAAEAGLEWAIGMLNAPYDINTSCALQSTTNVSFRRKYVQTQWFGSTPNSNVIPAENVFPGCKISGTTLTCSCPNVPSSGTATAALGTTVQPGFTVALSPVPTNPSNYAGAKDEEAVQVTVHGCTATANACAPGTQTSATGPDAVATVTATVKFRPLLRAGPAAALTCGGYCNPGGSYNIINTDPSTNGITINAGSTITLDPGANTATIPGLPPANAQIANDSSLAALYNGDTTCSNSSMFQAYFGSTIQQYAAAPSTKSITCTSASECGTAVNAAFADGWRAFYFPSGFSWNNSSGNLGTASDPVTIVTPGSFDINGNITIHGMVFSNSANLNDFGTGTADIIGAVVVCGNQDSNGNGTIQFDPSVLLNNRRSTAVAVRVNGSWSDNLCTLPAGNPRRPGTGC